MGDIGNKLAPETLQLAALADVEKSQDHVILVGVADGRCSHLEIAWSTHGGDGQLAADGAVVLETQVDQKLGLSMMGNQNQRETSLLRIQMSVKQILGGSVDEYYIMRLCGYISGTTSELRITSRRMLRSSSALMVWESCLAMALKALPRSVSSLLSSSKDPTRIW